MTDLPVSAPAARRRTGDSALYRAVWRWHFYAGLLVLPFMALLAVTGAIYLFKDEINAALHADLMQVTAEAGTPLPPSALAEAALTAYPGTLRGYRAPSAPDRSAEVRIRDAAGEKLNVYVNPWTGRVLGEAWDSGAPGSTAMWVVRKLHSLDYVGWWGNRMIEAVAGWAILLTLTGAYLWWPRGRGVGVLFPRRGATGRPFWRDLHATTGLWAGLILAFLALSGLPWSGFWGKQFYAISYDLGLGMPDGYWSGYPSSGVPTGEALDRAPWIMERTPMPVSSLPASAPAAERAPASLTGIVAQVERLGVAPGWQLDAPGDATGVWTVSVYPDDIAQERVVHFDQYTGSVLYDVGFAGLGPLGRAAEWGVSVHMGQRYGLVNQLLLLAVCLGILVMCVAAATMWWKRRPAGGLGAPRPPRDWRAPRAVLVIGLVCCALFPLTGLSLLAVLAIDLVLPSGLRARVA